MFVCIFFEWKISQKSFRFYVTRFQMCLKSRKFRTICCHLFFFLLMFFFINNCTIFSLQIVQYFFSIFTWNFSNYFLFFFPSSFPACVLAFLLSFFCKHLQIFFILLTCTHKQTHTFTHNHLFMFLIFNTLSFFRGEGFLLKLYFIRNSVNCHAFFHTIIHIGIHSIF